MTLLALTGTHGTVSAAPISGYVNEENFLEFTIDHHFSALRMTELAAGTATVGSSSNFAGSPISFPPSPQKATDPVALAIAVAANAAQRSDTLKMEGFLNVYYGISNFPPMILPENQVMIDKLDADPAGDPFNIDFLELFTVHHAELLPFAQECSAEAPHADVRDLCSNMVSSQSRQIAQMEAELRDRYGIIFAVPEPRSLALLAFAIALVCWHTRVRAADLRRQPVTA